MNNAILGLITYAAVMAVFKDVDRMLRVFIGPKLAKKLGRPITEWDWQVYWQEKAKRDWYEAWNYSQIQWQQRVVDRDVIRDFVWEARD